MPDQNQPNDLNPRGQSPSGPSAQNPIQGNTPIDPPVPARPNLTTEEVPPVPTVQDPNLSTPPVIPAGPLPIIPEATDVPPPPGSDLTDTVIPTGAPITNASPSFDMPAIASTPPKKKFGGKKVISTILGLLLLIGGISAGVVLTQRQQLFNQEAAGDQCGNECVRSGNSVADCKPATGFKCVNGFLKETVTSKTTTSKTTETSKASFGECQGGQKRFVDCTTKLSCPGKVEEDCVGGKFVTVGNQCQDVADNCPAAKTTTTTTTTNKTAKSGACSDSSAARCQNRAPGYVCDNNPPGSGVCKEKGDGSKDDDGNPICICKRTDNKCVEECPSSDGILRSCTPPDADGTSVDSICNTIGRVESCGGKSYCCPTVGGKWTADLSACQGSAQCTNVKAYKGDDTFTPLTADDLKALKAGDKVRFAVAGTSTGASGSFDKAKFKVNSTESPEVTTKKPSSEEFYYEFTIPEGTTSFNITAQIHHSVLGWSN